MLLILHIFTPTIHTNVQVSFSTPHSTSPIHSPFLAWYHAYLLHFQILFIFQNSKNSAIHAGVIPEKKTIFLSPGLSNTASILVNVLGRPYQNLCICTGASNIFRESIRQNH